MKPPRNISGPKVGYSKKRKWGCKIFGAIWGKIDTALTKNKGSAAIVGSDRYCSGREQYCLIKSMEAKNGTSDIEIRQMGFKGSWDTRHVTGSIALHKFRQEWDKSL